MRKFLLTVFWVLFLTGCATPNLKVHENNASLYVEDQVLKKFRIDNSFHYVGAFPFRSSNGLLGKRHTFEKSNTEAINILVLKTKQNFIKVNLTKNILDRGAFESGDKSYFYFTKKIEAKNYCPLSKTIQVPIQGDLKVMVQYIEDLNGTGINCAEWSDPWNLSDEQMEYLSSFNTNSINSIEIID